MLWPKASPLDFVFLCLCLAQAFQMVVSLSAYVHKLMLSMSQDYQWLGHTHL